MKKFISWLLALAMICSLAACAAPQGPVQTPVPTAAASPSAGLDASAKASYTGKAAGNNGELSVRVDVEDGRITEVEVLEHKESDGIADLPLERIPQDIVKYQSLMVDTVAGATMTSRAILEAAASALTNGGVDTAPYMAAPEKEDGAGELLELEADVIVVGGGGAGLAAAVSATQNGAAVIVAEKMPKLGGNTLISGSAYNAVAPDRQAAQGIEDSIELHYTQTLEGGDNKADPELVRTLVENAYPTLQWLENDLGIEFQEEIVQIVGSLHQRGFEPVEPLGTGYIKGYTTYLEANGTQILLDTRIDTILMEDGAAVGVSGTTSQGRPVTLRAKKGVIIATGGFGANVEMREKCNTLWPSLVNQPTTNHPGATGDGIVMAEAAGAQLVQMEYIQLHPMGDPETGSLNTNPLSGSVKNTIYVNSSGERFTAEDGRRDSICTDALNQEGGVFWAVMNINTYPDETTHKSNFNATMEELLASGHAVKGETLAELAGKMGVPADALQKTVESFNAAVNAGTDEFGRKLFDQPLTEGPFYAGARKPTVHHTMGGIKINPRAEVISVDGEVIPGLYAAGEVTGGIHGTNRLGGNALADINVFGKIAGENAAKR